MWLPPPPVARGLASEGGTIDSIQSSGARKCRSGRRFTTAVIRHKGHRNVVDQLRARFPKLAEMMEGAEHDVLAFMDSPRERSSNFS